MNEIWLFLNIVPGLLYTLLPPFPTLTDPSLEELRWHVREPLLDSFDDFIVGPKTLPAKRFFSLIEIDKSRRGPSPENMEDGQEFGIRIDELHAKQLQTCEPGHCHAEAGGDF